MQVKGIESVPCSIPDSELFAVVSSPANKGARLRTVHIRKRGAINVLILLLLTSLLLPPVVLGDAGDSQDQNSREQVLRNARKALRKGEFEQAASLYNDLAARNPQDIQARLGVSFAYMKMQSFARSYDAATEAVKIDKNNARAHALMGVSLLRSGFLRASVPELAESIRLDPKEALAYGGLAEIDYFDGRVVESRARALYAHRLDSDEPDYLMSYARASSRAEDYKEAADAYELFLLVAPQNDTERRERIEGLISFYRQLVGLQVHQITGPQVSEVPFVLGADRRPYIRLIINGHPALFVIDTGSGFTVISKEAAKRLGISEMARGGKSQGIGGTGKFPIIYGLIRSMQLGETRVRTVPCFVRPFHGTENRPKEERADGFIGLSILSHFLTQLDYQQSRMVLDRNVNQPVPVIDQPGSAVIPFRMTQNGLISIETEFDGTNPVNVILDSGASSSAVSMVAVDRLKMRDRIIKGQRTSVIGAAGITNDVEMLFLRNCRVADLGQSNLRALVLDFDAINETSGFEQSGILGGDFLRHFLVTLDFQRTQVRFQPHATPTSPQQ